MKGMEKLLKAAWFTPGLNGRWGLPLIFWGGPGVGKSNVIESAASLAGLHCKVMISSIREPSDYGGLPIPVPRGRRTFLEYTPPGWAADLEIDGDGRGVVFLDEITTCAPSVQAALLRLVLNGALGDYQLPSGIRFVSAANEVADAAGGWDLAAPLANRFGHLDWDVPSVSDWTDWLLGGMSSSGSGIDPAVEERRVMAVWPTSFARAKGLVSGFLKARPDLLNKLPTIGDTARSRAYPTPRTWELAIRGMASAEVHGLSDIETDELASAFVGPGPVAELVTYRTQVDLPDPSEVLDGKVSFEADPHRLDRTVAILGACTALVCEDKTPKKAARLERMWEILTEVCKDTADLTVPSARALVKQRLHLKAHAATETLRQLAPMLDAAGIRP